MDMRRGELFMHGRVFPLKPKNDVGSVRRVVVQESAQLQARFETNIIGRTVYWDLCSTCETWVSSPGSPTR